MENAYREFLLFNNGEKAGNKDNPRILLYHDFTTLNAEHDEVPWCSAFMCFVVEMAGLKSTRSAAARSWLKWGEPLGQPEHGCIAVLKRGSSTWQGHVACYIEETTSGIWLLGGNQNNKITIDRYDREKVLGYRGI